jgi:hypothetical protein
VTELGACRLQLGPVHRVEPDSLIASRVGSAIEIEIAEVVLTIR